MTFHCLFLDLSLPSGDGGHILKLLTFEQIAASARCVTRNSNPAPQLTQTHTGWHVDFEFRVTQGQPPRAWRRRATPAPARRAGELLDRRAGLRCESAAAVSVFCLCLSLRAHGADRACYLCLWRTNTVAIAARRAAGSAEAGDDGARPSWCEETLHFQCLSLYFHRLKHGRFSLQGPPDVFVLSVDRLEVRGHASHFAPIPAPAWAQDSNSGHTSCCCPL